MSSGCWTTRARSCVWRCWNKRTNQLFENTIGKFIFELHKLTYWTSPNVIFRFADSMQVVSRENKLRLMMIYAALNLEKFESDKGAKLMQVILKPKILFDNIKAF